MQTRIIEVVSYNSSWPVKFSTEKRLLTNTLGTNLISIEHIGSTSVAGLPAKPIIDMLLEVEDLALLDNANAALAACGYKAKGENGIAGRRYFQKGGHLRSHHIHAFKSGDIQLVKHRAYRDYLICHPIVAKAYGELKISAAQQCNHDMARYMALKNDFIQHHLKLALNWYKTR